ncbi:MAG TPA: hypothetical protein VGQ81_04815 [Acidobacteriota bacterium]|jgi:hypothetical protein|nr:hypothetical protein [Acidobacteriota bacterium]
MGRFILRYKGPGPKPDEDVELIRGLANTKVLDDSSRMLLVAAPESDLQELIGSMPDWVMSPEQTIQLPDPRPKILRDADEEKTGK